MEPSGAALVVPSSGTCSPQARVQPGIQGMRMVKGLCTLVPAGSLDV